MDAVPFYWQQRLLEEVQQFALFDGLHSNIYDDRYVVYDVRHDSHANWLYESGREII